MLDFFQSIVSMIWTMITTINDTADRIDSITFKSSVFSDWLGYARYVMGDPVYVLFSTTLLISLGASMWTFLLKGIDMLRRILPW